ncbi:response regulator [bacterium]|nr:response regulator [bacterium]
MLLRDFTLDKLAAAMRLYLSRAYPDGHVPEKARAAADLSGARSLKDALGVEAVETFESRDRPGFLEKYRWRLGNDFYSHMKLGLECCSDTEDFIFNVDTHDRELEPGSPLTRQDGYRELLTRNSALKCEIEAAWDAAGLPTFRGHINRHLQQKCVLQRDRKTVLIVDDDECILELERALLEEAGYRCVTALSGEAALARLAETGPVDLCLLDIMMPSLDGLALARRIHDDERTRCPVVYVTALPRERARDAVAVDYIAKPFDPDRLIECVRRHSG